MSTLDIWYTLTIAHHIDVYKCVIRTRSVLDAHKVVRIKHGMVVWSNTYYRVSTLFSRWLSNEHLSPVAREPEKDGIVSAKMEFVENEKAWKAQNLMICQRWRVELI